MHRTYRETGSKDRIPASLKMGRQQKPKRTKIQPNASRIGKIISVKKWRKKKPTGNRLAKKREETTEILQIVLRENLG